MQSMLFCPYCPEEERKPMKNAAGFSGHLRKLHKGKWKDGLEVSLPPDYSLWNERENKRHGTKPAVATKGGRNWNDKPMIHCPECDYSHRHPPAMTNHLKGNHPVLWKRTGSLKAALAKADTPTFVKEPVERLPIERVLKRGRKLTDLSTLEPKTAELLARRRIYEANRRKKFKRLGLNASGKPYKHGPRNSTTETPDVERRHKVEPIVYHAPFEVPVHECPGCKMKFPPGVTWREAE